MALKSYTNSIKSYPNSAFTYSFVQTHNAKGHRTTWILDPLKGKVVAVCRNPEPALPKPVVDAVYLIENWGVEGDYHAGSLVRHRYLAKKDPNKPNLR